MNSFETDMMPSPEKKPEPLESKAEKMKAKVRKLATGALVTLAAGFGGGKAEAKTADTKASPSEKTVVHDPHDKHLKSYNDSLALYNYYKTQAKYLGVEEVKPFSQADFTADDAAYKRELIKAIHDTNAVIDKRFREAVAKGQKTEAEYQAWLASDTLKVPEKFLHQAGVQIEKEKRDDEAVYGLPKGKGRPENFSVDQGYELVHKHMHPSGEFIDNAGHPHRVYEKPKHEVAYEPDAEPKEGN